MHSHNYDKQEREAVAWAIGEAADNMERWAAEDDADPVRLERERERLKTLGQLADDLGAQSAVNDCKAAISAIELALKRQPGRETRGAGAAAKEA